MLNYFFRRILIFIPTLIVISLLAFVISAHAPGDPVEKLMTAAASADIANANTAAQQQQRIYWTHRLGLDLPVFYFSLTSLAFPDTLYRIVNKNEKEALTSLIQQYGNWKSIESYHQALQQLNREQEYISLDTGLIKNFSTSEIHDAITQSRFNSTALLSAASGATIEAKIKTLAALYTRYPFLGSSENSLRKVEEKYLAMIASQQCWKNFIPVIHFYPDNQYHRWVFGDGDWLTGEGSVFSKGMIRGDLGVSYDTGQPVSTEISDHIGWSFFFTFVSLIIAYLISIPIGIQSAIRQGSRFDRFSSVVLFLLHSMPIFWVATLLLMTFANVEVIYWFPASGVKPVTGYPEHASFFEKIKISLPFLILPIIAYTYSSLAYLSRLMRVSMLEVIHQDYIRTARAKGLTDKKVIYKHALRNAWLPIITVFASVFPAAVGGSVILETIFTIPGIGLETFQAIQTQNYPVIVGVFTITGVMTLAGYLIADMLYAAVDPRISFSAKR